MPIITDNKIKLPNDFPISSPLINDLPIPNWETMNHAMTPNKLENILKKPRILVYCHPKSSIYETPNHYMKNFIEARIKNKYGEQFNPKTNSIIYTLDINGNPTIITDGFSDNFLQKYNNFFDMVFVLDCSGPWQTYQDMDIMFNYKDNKTPQYKHMESKIWRIDQILDYTDIFNDEEKMKKLISSIKKNNQIYQKIQNVMYNLLLELIIKLLNIVKDNGEIYYGKIFGTFEHDNNSTNFIYRLLQELKMDFIDKIFIRSMKKSHLVEIYSLNNKSKTYEINDLDNFLKKQSDKSVDGIIKLIKQIKIITLITIQNPTDKIVNNKIESLMKTADDKDKPALENSINRLQYYNFIINNL
jgi:hypothetical protein